MTDSMPQTRHSALLIGSPNCGKTLLFNRLTGLQHRVANFPGITVEIASGKLSGHAGVTLYDYPGTYSLQAISGEEQVAVEQFELALKNPELGVVMCVIDVTRLEKSLYFALQVIRECGRAGKPVLVLANMIDVLENHHISMDLEALSRDMGATVLGISARTGQGLDHLDETIREQLSNPQCPSDNQDPDILLRGNAHQLARNYGPKGDVLLRTQNRMDAFFLHTGFGGIAFFAIMYLLFQSIFTWSAPAMDAVESGLAWLSDLVVPMLAPKLVQDFAADALFSGIGAFLVFVPQIFVLTFVIGLLEDSGYMARAALICHRPLRFFGLTGKSFIPMLSGVACAIPGIYAARSIDSPRRRFLTYMAIPLMPCSARLPVYTLLIAAFIPSTTALGGLVGYQGLAMFMVYLFGMLCGLLVTAMVSRFSTQQESDLPFVLEMPAYRLPTLVPLLRKSWRRSQHFITKAGGIIITVTVVIWVLGYFPNYGADLGASWLGQIGRFVEPVFAPIGLDWRYGVAVMSSFLAREVFVGTLGVMFGIEGAEENMVPLVAQIQNSDLGLASGVALLVFFAVALMCVSTLAVLSKEAGSNKLAIRMFLVYSGMAYVFALIAYQVVTFLGG
ncbi:MAG: ferrous iron transport protein B [Glaciecola sp.]|jgi:ferrous iron transport protein B|uniref:ferrous iron transporter B n=1 Tax=Congregibacter sp. TaxID=2744308 RepID=UPI0039E62EAE